MIYTVYDSIGIWLAETRDVTRAQEVADQEAGFVRDENGMVIYETFKTEDSFHETTSRRDRLE